YLGLWIALDHVPPERGSMRFLSGSHAAGPLGWEDKHRGGYSLDVLQMYPRLERTYEWSPRSICSPAMRRATTCWSCTVPPRTRRLGPGGTTGLFYIPADTRYDGNDSVPELTMGYPPHIEALN